MQVQLFERLESDVRGYCRSWPTVFTSARGWTLEDESGRRYLDFFAGAGALNYGHNHPELVERMVDHLQSGGILVLTGKGFGATNLLALDRTGRVVTNKTVEVVGAKGADLVVVYRGMERESYSCAPVCERRITLGDSPAYFNNALSQSGTRNREAATPPK